MKPCPFAKASFIQPVLDGLTSCGVDPAPIVRRSGLGAFNLGDQECYLPLPLLDKLVDRIEQDQGVRDLAVEFKPLIELSCCGEWGEMLSSSPSMLSVCRKAEAAPDVVFTNERLRLRIEGKVARYEQWFTDPGAAQRTQLIQLNASLMLNTFKLFLGEDWEPLEVHFQCETAMNLEPFFPGARRTRVYTGMPTTGLVLDAGLLGRRASASTPVRNRQPGDFQVPKSCAERVEVLLTSTAPGVVPTIREAANYLDTSERSLRRALAQESATYADLVDQWRCTEALQMMGDGRLRTGEIAEFLGYSNTPSFFRAFKRWTNHTPSSFRDLEAP